MAKINQTKEELENHLQEQLNFLKKSAESFDEGFLEEAKRMSVVIRTLVHDTRNSTSLLKQLNKKDVLFLDTANPYNPNNIISQFCLLSLKITHSGANFSALLDTQEIKKLEFSKWWNKIIIADKHGQTITRRELILTLANQDGGAHIDPKLDEKYANLFRFNSLDIFVNDPHGSQKPMKSSHLVSARQIAHEVLKTLIDDYEIDGPSPKIIPDEFHDSNEISSDGHSITIKGPRIKKGKVIREPYRSKKIGRNEDCPCGSGKKYKNCHGA